MPKRHLGVFLMHKGDADVLPKESSSVWVVLVRASSRAGFQRAHRAQRISDRAGENDAAEFSVARVEDQSASGKKPDRAKMPGPECFRV